MKNAFYRNQTITNPASNTTFTFDDDDEGEPLEERRFRL
jgi:hypothetical protein